MPFEKRTQKKDIDSVLCKDRYFLKRLLNKLPPVGNERFSNQLQGFQKRLKQSQEAVKSRQATIPKLTFPKPLPISSKLDDIIETVRYHQVVVITGETGSGKTTQIPKMCLKAGRGIFGKIGCTQPRRIAATSLARKVASEMNTELGNLVGYKIRFEDKTNQNTLLQFMTDGVLLAEIQSDRYLNAYDTIIIDEAHERTLNIDFLLGYIKKLLPQRPELKLIITSATIDVEKFAGAFPEFYNQHKKAYFLFDESKSTLNTESIKAPILEVSGRMYPVEVRYHPIDEIQEEQGDQTMIDLVQEAVEEILTETSQGDILVFMSGEMEIRETVDRLKYLETEGFNVLPLFGRLTIAEQNKIFETNSHRKIILSTNIAETSITVPGIQFVVDTGRARISQYNTRSGTQGLPVKAISQSSADQRKGRCGRVSNGICVRLFTREDYENRSCYTTPEIQRSNLSEVILRLLDLQLGDIDTFPFVDPPESSQIRAGFRTLRELGAMNEQKRLTPIGKTMASLPVDPRTARMIIQARQENVLYPVLVIASAISCQDPRERPDDKKTQAGQKHAVFKSRESDLMTILNLWEEYHSTLNELKSQGKMRKFCKANFLSYNRIREWRDIYLQLLNIVKEKKWIVSKPDNWDYDGIHRSILAGYLPHIAKKKEKKLYQGTKNRELMLFPGSDQYQSQHEWIVAIELIETSKLFAHRVAKINPDWLETLAGNLCKKSWSEPRWDSKNSNVIAWEKVTLFGFTLVEKRVVFYGKIDRQAANDVFIREALVEGNFESQLPFWKHNQALIKEIQNEENKIRKKDLLVEDSVIENFYQNLISGVACLNDLKKLIRQHSGDKFLFMTKADLLRREPDENVDLFPPQLKIGKRNCRLKYVFEPGHKMDGVTVEIPETLLSSVREDSFEYLVPGLLKEKINWFLKNLPKDVRKKLVPIPEKAERVWEDMTSLRYSTQTSKPVDTPLGDFYQEFTESLFRLTKIHIPPEDWDRDNLPDYLRMNFAVRNPKTKKTRYGRRLIEIQSTANKQKDDWTLLITPHQRHNIDNWDFGNLLEEVRFNSTGDIILSGYRTLELSDKELFITLSKTPDEAVKRSLAAIPTILERQLGDKLAWLFSELRFPPETVLQFQALWEGSEILSLRALQKKFSGNTKAARKNFHDQLQKEVYQMVHQGLCGYNGNPLWTEKAFLKRLEEINRQLNNLGENVVDWINQAMALYGDIRSDIGQQAGDRQNEYWMQLNHELSFFLSHNCLQHIPLEQWRHCPRILRCYQRRIMRFLEDPGHENDLLNEVTPYQQKAEQLVAESKSSEISKFWAIRRFCWMLEEYKISMFAQDLTTAFPISTKRLDRFLKDHMG